MQSTTRCNRGFTLVELIVAMLIAAILAAIAVPSYLIYVRKSRRTEAKSALLDIASLEERYFSAQNTYSNLPTDVGYTAAAPPFPVGSGYYQITQLGVVPAGGPTAASAGGTPATYTLVATAVGDQVNDTQCYTFTVTSGGARTAQNSAGVDNTANCW
jgi:type IV pilus assembly protein PilE